MQDKTYIIIFKAKQIEENLQDSIEIQNNKISLKEEELKNIKVITKQGEALLKALMRGIFLGAGAINNPEKTNQLSIGTSQEIIANLILEELEKNDIKYKIS